MNRLDNKKLTDDLTEWFKTADFNDKNFMSRDPILLLIKKQLKLRKRWKELSRGKPGFPNKTKDNIDNDW